MRVLIVKLGSIGDVVHALPTAAAIKRNFPDYELSWVVERRAAEMLRGSPVIDELIEIDTKSGAAESRFKGIAGQARDLRRREKFDITLDLQGLIKSSVVSRIADASERWGFAKKDLREPAGRFLYDRTAEAPPRSHVIIKNMALAGAALGFDPLAQVIEFPIATADEHKAEAERIIGDAERIALLNPAGGWVTKLWPAPNFGKLADAIATKLQMTPILVTAPGESALADEAIAASASGKMAAAVPTLKGFFELARRSAIYIGGDTGPTHIAAAAGTPVVGIFGPTEWWRNGSLDPRDVCVERNDIDCRVNCHRRECGHWICMDIPVETVFNAVKARLDA